MGIAVIITLIGFTLVATMLALFMPGTPGLPMFGDADGPKLILMFLGAAWTLLGCVQFLRFGRSKLSKALIVLVTVLTLLGAGGGAYWVLGASYDLPAPPEMPAGEPVPSFELEDQHGRVVSDASLRGKPYVLIFPRGVW